MAQWLWLLKDCEQALTVLVDDAESRGVGEGAARDMVLLRALIAWLKGGEPPGAEAIGRLERALRTVPRDPSDDERAQRDVTWPPSASWGETRTRHRASGGSRREASRSSRGSWTSRAARSAR